MQSNFNSTKSYKRKTKANRKENEEEEMSAARKNTPPAQSTIKVVREWFSFGVAIITIVVGIVFWVQKSGDGKYKVLEQDILELKQDLKEITKQNSEILRLIGQLEGKIDR
tara:strand:+ start:17134 stop:17466 length:333 start_codon:yes stop_codon:yes gene_type:complete